jgi:excisionase family DNA binding protein
MPWTDTAGIAEAIDVHEETVRRLVRASAIPFYRVGRVLRFDIDEVRAALRADGSSPGVGRVEPDFAALSEDAP